MQIGVHVKLYFGRELGGSSYDFNKHNAGTNRAVSIRRLNLPKGPQVNTPTAVLVLFNILCRT